MNPINSNTKLVLNIIIWCKERDKKLIKGEFNYFRGIFEKNVAKIRAIQNIPDGARYE